MDRVQRFIEMDWTARRLALGRKLALRPRVLGRTKTPSLMIACFPKSASTFLQNLVQESQRALQHGSFVPAYGRREQVIDEAVVRRNRLYGRSIVAHQHARANEHLLDACRKNNIRILVLTRNLPDALVSLRDHVDNEGPDGFMFTATSSEWTAMSELERYQLLGEYALPWYVEFAAGWIEVIQRGLPFVDHVTYHQVVGESKKDLSAALLRLGFEGIRPDVLTAKARTLEQSPVMSRINKGSSGRGNQVFREYGFLQSRLDSLLKARPSGQQQALREFLLSAD